MLPPENTVDEGNEPRCHDNEDAVPDAFGDVGTFQQGGEGQHGDEGQRCCPFQFRVHLRQKMGDDAGLQGDVHHVQHHKHEQIEGVRTLELQGL